VPGHVLPRVAGRSVVGPGRDERVRRLGMAPVRPSDPGAGRRHRAPGAVTPSGVTGDQDPGGILGMSRRLLVLLQANYVVVYAGRGSRRPRSQRGPARWSISRTPTASRSFLFSCSAETWGARCPAGVRSRCVAGRSTPSILSNGALPGPRAGSCIPWSRMLRWRRSARWWLRFRAPPRPGSGSGSPVASTGSPRGSTRCVG